MNALAGGVDQPRAFAAQRLRQQEPRRARHAQRRRMELHELEIGDAARRRGTPSRSPSPVATAGFVVSRKTCPAPPVASSTRPRRAVPTRAVAVEEPRRRRTRRPRRRATCASASCDDVTPGVRRDARPQHAADLAAGRVARVQHAAHAVRAFARQRRLAVGVAIERRAPRRSARARSAGLRRRARRTARSSHRPSPAAIVSARVQVRRVVGADGGGDAALRVAGVALAGLGLGEDEDVAGAGERRRPRAGRRCRCR